ncbi:uncharacterized protein LOC121747342 [Salvia splendens]|uniref:uncharacterized protein LOC121747342 n=1 Tax=Salvia splendens TaxID=180675 RepID=UPI001C25E056|nr:uncharacterized protein LOC121746865 isoform X1 [Salvia splendens]XP_041996749.1 uncharacterized protein LOC121746865 isoform X2 [Salvia splendens]XP_041997310.1 uncharacterized protein LOC121747342 [Salvia splendens]
MLLQVHHCIHLRKSFAWIPRTPQSEPIYALVAYSLLTIQDKRSSFKRERRKEKGPNLISNQSFKINLKCFYKSTIAFTFERASRGYLARLNRSPSMPWLLTRCLLYRTKDQVLRERGERKKVQI